MSLQINPRAKATHIFDRAAQDFYIEPEWCSEALFAAEPFNGPIHDPACGTGRIVRSAIKAGYAASGSDIIERSHLRDFAFDYLSGSEPISYPNIVCNPPYDRTRKARQARRKAMGWRVCNA